MEKSPEAFRTIREVADSLDLPQHVLRFWETRFPQIRPLKRAGGRRYYRPDDIERLRLVKRLLYDEGYTIKGVQKLFKAQGVHTLTVANPLGAFGSLAPSSAVESPADPARPSTSNAKGRSGRASATQLADEELKALRSALAKINEAGRILAQTRVRAP
jgi:DNA-binding transcriptional MerR regulator